MLSHKNNMTLTGHYKSIEISDSKSIRIENLEADFINVIDSDDIVIENSRINGKDVALHTRESRIKVTGGQLSGETAVIASGSIIDLAGVKLTGKKAAVQATVSSRVLFSVSRIESPFNKGYIHGLYVVRPRSPL